MIRLLPNPIGNHLSLSYLTSLRHLNKQTNKHQKQLHIPFLGTKHKIQPCTCQAGTIPSSYISSPWSPHSWRCLLPSVFFSWWAPCCYCSPLFICSALASSHRSCSSQFCDSVLLLPPLQVPGKSHPQTWWPYLLFWLITHKHVSAPKSPTGGVYEDGNTAA